MKAVQGTIVIVGGALQQSQAIITHGIFRLIGDEDAVSRFGIGHLTLGYQCISQQHPGLVIVGVQGQQRNTRLPGGFIIPLSQGDTCQQHPGFHMIGIELGGFSQGCLGHQHLTPFQMAKPFQVMGLGSTRRFIDQQVQNADGFDIIFFQCRDLALKHAGGK